MVAGGGSEHGGGIGRLLGYLVSSWPSSLGSQVKVLDSRGPGNLVLWPLFLLMTIGCILKNAFRNPLLHIHLAANCSTWRKWIITEICGCFRITFVLQLHDGSYRLFYNSLPAALQKCVRRMFMRAARVIVLGTPAASMVNELLGIPRHRITILPNAVIGPERFITRDKPLSERTKILFLGRLQPRKGVHDLITALAHERVRDLAWDAVLAGGGPDQKTYEKLTIDLGLTDRISFPGWLDQASIRQLLSDANVLVLPSYAEEMAMSVLEGMAFGLCVICTRVGALGDVVQPNLSALVVPPGDPEELAATLAKCITDPALRLRLGAAARQTFLEHYNMTDYPTRLSALYENL